MTQNEKDIILHKLNEEQLQLAAIMSQSDAHASKCIKLGLNFAETYPDDYEAYTSARQQYNYNEYEIARIEAEEVDPEELTIEENPSDNI